METKFIELDEYIKNIVKILNWKNKHTKYIISSDSKPIFEINPIAEEDWDTKYTKDNNKARLEAMKELEDGEITDGKEFLEKLIEEKNV